MKLKQWNISHELINDICIHSNDIEFYLSYLSHYFINGKEERCTESGKARKLSSLRSFYNYYFHNSV